MPSSKGYKRNYQQEYANESAARKKKRAMRNKARKIMQKAGKVKKGDGKDVHHKDGNAMRSTKKNLAVKSASSNRSYPRTKTAGKKNKRD